MEEKCNKSLQLTADNDDITILWEHTDAKKAPVNSTSSMNCKTIVAHDELSRHVPKSRQSCRESVVSATGPNKGTKRPLSPSSSIREVKKKAIVCLGELDDTVALRPVSQGSSATIQCAPYKSYITNVGAIEPGPLPPTDERSGRWTELERLKLYEATNLYSHSFNGHMSWKKASMYLGGARTPTQCRDRWALELIRVENPEQGIPPVITKWPDDVEAALEVAVREHTFTTSTSGGNCVRWKGVSEALQNRFSAQQCRRYWLAQQAVATGNWTAEEDAMLTNAIHRLGEPGSSTGTGVLWRHISQEVTTGRTATQCRNRWRNCASMGYGRASIEGGGNAATVTSHSGSTSRSPCNVTLPGDGGGSSSQAADIESESQSSASAAAPAVVIREGMWTDEEDRRLLEGVRGHTYSVSKSTGVPKRNQLRIAWQDVARLALGGQRCPQQCLKRYSRLKKKSRKAHE